MHAQASLFMPLFDSLLPATEQRFTDRQSTRPRKPTTLEAVRAQGETLLSMAKLHERLALLAQLELPCSIVITTPSLHLRDVVIKTAELIDDCLVIAGQDFNLRLRGPNIHSIRLVNQRGAGEGVASLDIHHAQGMLYASIQPPANGIGDEVWRDVMDNPTLAFV